METTAYIIGFLTSLGFATLGTYLTGKKSGKKEMLEVLFEKNLITRDTYFKFKKIIEE